MVQHALIAEYVKAVCSARTLGAYANGTGWLIAPDLYCPIWRERPAKGFATMDRLVRGTWLPYFARNIGVATEAEFRRAYETDIRYLDAGGLPEKVTEAQAAAIAEEDARLSDEPDDLKVYRRVHAFDATSSGWVGEYMDAMLAILEIARLATHGEDTYLALDDFEGIAETPAACYLRYRTMAAETWIPKLCTVCVDIRAQGSRMPRMVEGMQQVLDRECEDFDVARWEYVPRILSPLDREIIEEKLRGCLKHADCLEADA